MKTSDNGLFALAMHEGIIPAPYFDSVDVLTYGIGHTASAGAPDPLSLAKGMPADMDAALRDVVRVYLADIGKYEADVSRAVKVPLLQNEFDALVSFHFNTGAIGKATFVKHLNAGNKAAAAKGFMAWVKPASLKGRRTAEQRLFLTGEYPAGSIVVWGVGKACNVIWKPVRRVAKAEFLAMINEARGAAIAPSKPVTAAPEVSPAPQKRSVLGDLAAMLIDMLKRN